MPAFDHIDAHEGPSPRMREFFKVFQKQAPDLVACRPDLVDLRRAGELDCLEIVDSIPSSRVGEAFDKFLGHNSQHTSVADVPVYQLKSLPGFLIVPSLLPQDVQQTLLVRLLHRDLSNPMHNTNLHIHYQVEYPPTDPSAASSDPSETLGPSFFSYSTDSSIKFMPKDLNVHSPLPLTQALNKKLHWITLGGQYDWTNRAYPAEDPLAFPPDIGALVRSLFPSMEPQAAIVNFYSPGDSMMMHRDVSEFCDQGLASLSLGCDCVFLIGVGQKEGEGGSGSDTVSAPCVALRLRSGDAIYMSKDARVAWHGVPKILPDTCPEFLQDLPVGSEPSVHESWRGWMKSKRVNVNVRQMYD